MTWISFIKGILASQEEKQAIVDVNGIGYTVAIPPRAA